MPMQALSQHSLAPLTQLEAAIAQLTVVNPLGPTRVQSVAQYWTNVRSVSRQFYVTDDPATNLAAFALGLLANTVLSTPSKSAMAHNMINNVFLAASGQPASFQ